ncbi:hypothetical protein D3C74_266240 [compost metagenome]
MFQIKQPGFHLQAAAVAGERAVFADYPMAGNGDQQRVGSDRRTNGADGGRFSDGLGDIRVRTGLPEGNVAKRLPYRELKRRSPQIEGEGETFAFGRQILRQLSGVGCQALLVLHERTPWEAAAGPCG